MAITIIQKNNIGKDGNSENDTKKEVIIATIPIHNKQINILVVFDIISLFFNLDNSFPILHLSL